MKTLKESILSSTNTGKSEIIRKRIEKWCEKHNIFYGKFKINDKLEIEKDRNYPWNNLFIKLKDNEEVPSYIKFASDPYMLCNVSNDNKFGNNGLYKGKKLDLSFIPKECLRLDIHCDVNIISNLTVKAKVLGIYALNIKKFENVDFEGVTKNSTLELYITDFKSLADTGIKIKNCNTIHLADSYKIAYTFDFEINREKDPNKKREQLSKENVQFINDFIGNDIDIKSLENIIYSSVFKVYKDKNKWYRIRR